jgi:hypothetical protein
MMTTAAPASYSGPIHRSLKQRRTAYIDAASGAGVDSDGQGVQLQASPTLAAIVAFALGTQTPTIYLTGPMPGDETVRGLQSWILAPCEGWEDAQSFLGDSSQPPTIRQRHRASGFVCTVRHISSWLGDDADVTPTGARAALAAVLETVRAHFGPGVVLLGTPAQTGRDLWDRVRTVDYPTLPAELQGLVHRTSGQGRAEICTLPDLQRVPGFYYLDGRLMYAASATNLGCGEYRHDDRPDFERYTRGRYRVRFTVPAGWDHVGLLMTPRPDVHEGWWYPAMPGETHETWASWTELALALDRGWHIEIRERLLFAGPCKGTPAPLDTWVARLEHAWGAAGDPLVRDALRGIILFTIGAFARSGRAMTRVVRRADRHLLPTDNATVRTTETGDFTYQEWQDLPARELRYCHPEWAAEIWARVRTRMLFYQQKRGRGEVVGSWGALTVPRAHVLAVRTDALYLSYDPAWPDDGEPGSMRLKGRIAKAVRAPHTLDDLNPLRDRAVAALRKGDA